MASNFCKGVAVAVATASLLLAGLPAAPAGADEGPVFRRIRFPAEGSVRYGDDFGDPRSGGRSHEGNDLMGVKLQRLVAAVDGK